MAIIKIEGLKTLTDYKFYVVAKTSTSGRPVFSPPSEIQSITTLGDTIPPDPITGLGVDFNTSTFTASWNGDAAETANDFLDYNIIISKPSGTSSFSYYTRNKTFSLSLDQNRTIFSSPSPSVTIYVASRDTSANKSAFVSATGVNPAPTEAPSVNATGIIQGFAASWTAPSSNFTDYSYTEVYYNTTSSFYASATTPAWRGNGTYAEISQISSYTPIYIKARHFDVFNQASPESTVASATPINPDGTDTTPPGTASINGASFNGSTLEVYFKRPVDTDLSTFKINLYATNSTASPVMLQNADTTTLNTVQIFRLSLDQNTSIFGSPQSNISGNIYSKDFVGNTSSSYANFNGSAVFTAPSVTYNNVQWGTAASGLTAAALSYTVSWDDVSACPAFGYTKVFESTTASTSGWSQVYQGQSNIVTISSLANQRWVYVQHYTVFNNAGASATPKLITPTNPVVINTTAPTNATNLTTTASNDLGSNGLTGYIIATWTQSTASNVRGYRLRLKPFDDPSGLYQYENTASGTASYQINGLVPGFNYEVGIAAYDELNNTSSYTLSSPSTVLVPYGTKFSQSTTASAAASSSIVALATTVSGSMVGQMLAGYGLSGGTRITASLSAASVAISPVTSSAFTGSTVYVYPGMANWQSYITAGSTTPYMKIGTGVDGFNSGISLDSNNYWFTNGNIKVGTGSAYLQWDGTTLWLTGNINAKSGSFTGNVELGSGGSLFAASPTGGSVVLNSNGISAKNSAGTNTFVISSQTGYLAASYGTIGGWTASPTILSSNNVSIDSSGSITLGAVATGSTVILSATDPTYRLWIGAATPTAAAFRVDKIGTVYANSASITGDITANSGYFLGDLSANTLTLTGNEFIYGSLIAASAARITSASRTATSSIVFGLNVANPFGNGAIISIGGISRDVDGVYTASTTAAGSLTVYDAGPTGSILIPSSTAYAASYGSGPRVTISSSGLFAYNGSNEQIVTLPTSTGAQAQIAGWYITSGSLTRGSGATRVALSSASNSGDYVFWAGADSPTAASIRITNTGSIIASAASITGNITANTLIANSSGSIAGWAISANAFYKTVSACAMHIGVTAASAPSSSTSPTNAFLMAYNYAPGYLTTAYPYTYLSNEFIKDIDGTIIARLSTGFNPASGSAQRNIYLWSRAPSNLEDPFLAGDAPVIQVDDIKGAAAGYIGSYAARTLSIESYAGDGYLSVDGSGNFTMGTASTGTFTLGTSLRALGYAGDVAKITNSQTAYIPLTIEATSGAWTGTMLRLNQGRASTTSSTVAIIVARVNTSTTPTNVFRVSGAGAVFGTGAYNSSGADYAEMFEWLDGNPMNENRIGCSVELVNNKIILSTVNSENIIGVVSCNPTSVGDSAWNYWSNMYLLNDLNEIQYKNINIYSWSTEEINDFGRIEKKNHSYDEDQIELNNITVPLDAVITLDKKPIINPEYNPNLNYIPRENRPEWATIGMVGKLRVLKGQPVSPRWIKMRDISATVEEWLVR